MKRILLIILLLPQLSLADDAGMPPNPFQNIPADEGDYDPFESDFDEGGFADEPAPTYPPPNFGRSNTPPAFGSNAGSNQRPPAPSSSTPLNGGGAPSLNRNNKVERANCSEVVDSFDYPDSEILDVAKAISKLTGKNFIYNPQDVKGRISIVSNTTITVCDAYNAFLAAINMKGFALIPSGKYLRIERVGSAKEKQTPIYSSKSAPNNEEFITRVVPLRYIDAVEVEQTFRMWMPREARLQAYAQTNTLIITDTATHIDRMMELISLLDVAGYQESLVVIPIHNSTARDLAKIIEQIISDSSKQQNRFGAQPRPTPTFGASANSAAGRKGGMQISKIIADDRTNSLIIKANAVGLTEIRAIVRRLDTKVAPAEGSGRIHVVRLQFANAEEVSKTLGSITQSAAKTGANRFNSFGSFGQPPAPDNTQVFQGEIKISADKFTQSLVITASPSDFFTLKKVIETLDVPRDQVFVEAVIMEVAMGRDNAIGTSFISAPNGMALPSASGSMQKVLGGGNPFDLGGLVLGFKSGESRDFTVGTGDSAKIFKLNTLNGLLDLITANTDSNIIATPQVIALDNQEAEIKIGDTIPQEEQTVTSTGLISKGYKEKDASLVLKVKPQINKGSDFVKLDIEQTLDKFDTSNVPEGLQGITTGKSTRSTKTSAVVQNEDTVVISGLMRDTVDTQTKKVPLLGDIPILGWLFKNSKTSTRKTNLLVFITPKIIKQYDAIRKILMSRLEKRDEYIHDSLGSQDPMRKQIDELKAGLPILSKLNPLPVAESIDARSFGQPTGSTAGEQDEPEPWDNGSQPFITPPQDVMPTPIDSGAPPPPVMDNPGGFQ